MSEHLQRLRASLKTVGIPPPPALSPLKGERKKVRGVTFEMDSVAGALRKAAQAVWDGSVRVAVRRDPSEPPALSPRAYGSMEPEAGRRPGGPLLIHRQRGIPYSGRIRAAGASVVTVPSRWPAAETGAAQAKASERLGGVLARIEGRGAVEVLRLSPRGVLTEGTVSNLFMIQRGVLCTPPRWLGVLEGVTRSRVIRAARRLRIPVQEIPFSRHDLFNADEAFLTNVLMGILPIREVDGRRIGKGLPGPLTRRLIRALEKQEG